VPEEALPVKCTEHDKVIPHYRCDESERWLDERDAVAPSTTEGHRSMSDTAERDGVQEVIYGVPC
jgi:hypothetical protein